MAYGREEPRLKGLMWFLPASPREPIMLGNCLFFCDLELGNLMQCHSGTQEESVEQVRTSPSCSCHLMTKDCSDPGYQK